MSDDCVSLVAALNPKDGVRPAGEMEDLTRAESVGINDSAQMAVSHMALYRSAPSARPTACSKRDKASSELPSRTWSRIVKASAISRPWNQSSLFFMRDPTCSEA